MAGGCTAPYAACFCAAPKRSPTKLGEGWVLRSRACPLGAARTGAELNAGHLERKGRLRNPTPIPSAVARRSGLRLAWFAPRFSAGSLPVIKLLAHKGYFSRSIKRIERLVGGKAVAESSSGAGAGFRLDAAMPHCTLSGAARLENVKLDPHKEALLPRGMAAAGGGCGNADRFGDRWGGFHRQPLG